MTFCRAALFLGSFRNLQRHAFAALGHTMAARAEEVAMYRLDGIVHADITEEQRRALTNKLCVGVEIIGFHPFIINPDV